MTLTPAVWDGWQPGDPLPPEIQAIVDRTVQGLLSVFYVRADREEEA